MITIILNEGTKKCFNLNNNEREKDLYNAWYSMNGDKKFADKKLKITTHRGEKLLLKISEIKECTYEDCIYYDNPEVKNFKKKEKKKEKPMSFMDQIHERQKKIEEKNIEKFFNELKRQNIIINLDDPMLQRILQSVKKETSGTKIHFYANMYVNFQKNRNR